MAQTGGDGVSGLFKDERCSWAHSIPPQLCSGEDADQPSSPAFLVLLGAGAAAMYFYVSTIIFSGNLTYLTCGIVSLVYTCFVGRLFRPHWLWFRLVLIIGTGFYLGMILFQVFAIP